MRNIKSLLLLGMLIPQICFSNGGPVDGAAIKNTGKIVLLKYYDISLVKEELNIKLEGDYSIIEVTYLLKNEDYGDTLYVDFGFPVDYSFGEMGWSVKGELIRWEEDYVPYFYAYDGSKELSVSEHFDMTIFNDSALSRLHEFRNASGDAPEKEYKSPDYKRKWYVTRLSFLKNEQKKLVIKYKIKNSFTDWATSKSYFPYFDSRSLFYDLRPASFWGKSDNVNVSIRINIGQNLSSGDSVFIHGIEGFILKDSIYEYANATFDFTKSEPLEISYQLENFKMSALIKESARYQGIRSIRSSHSNKTKNNIELTDSNIYSSLCLKNTEKAWIEIEFRNFKPEVICMLNGNFTSKEAYYNSARLKKLLLQANLSDSIYDENAGNTNFITDTIDIPDMAFSEFTSTSFSKFITTLWDKYWIPPSMEKIKITVLEVYPGKVDNCICIPELFFLTSRFE